MDLVEDGQREDLADARHRAEPMKRVSIVALRLADDREVEVNDERIILVDQREVDRDALLHTGIGKVLHHPVAIGAISEFSPKDRQGVLGARVLDVSQELMAVVESHLSSAPAWMR